jgi:hypothetical protein
LLEWQKEVRDPQEFLQNLKIELYPEEVYIFTPKGEVAAAARRTLVDFADAIHTDVGHQCVGARVNGKMVPLRTKLRTATSSRSSPLRGTSQAGIGSTSCGRRGPAARSGTSSGGREGPVH